MSEFTERENAFINGLVRVIEASNTAFQAEQEVASAMERNFEESSALREERNVEMEDVARYLDEAIERSPFTDTDEVVTVMRDGLLLAQALTEGLDDAALRQANSNLPIL